MIMNLKSSRYNIYTLGEKLIYVIYIMDRKMQINIENFGKSIEDLHVSQLDECRISNVILLRDTAETLNTKQDIRGQIKLFLVRVFKCDG